MSDHPQDPRPEDDMPDPVDEAYVRAQAMLSPDEDAARAARRARVLAAVASSAGQEPEPEAGREPAADLVQLSPRRRALPRWGGWLAAASVAAVSLLMVTQFYQPIRPPPPATTAAANASPPPPSGPVLAKPNPTADGAAAPPNSEPLKVAPAQAEPPPPSEAARDRLANHPAPEAAAPPAPTPPPVAYAQPAPLPPPPPQPADNVVAGASRRAAPTALAAPQTAAPQKAAPLVAPLAAAPRATTNAPAARDEADGLAIGEMVVTAERTAPRDPAARLRIAAAQGSLAEAKTLIAHGASVDAADADGDTALIVAVRADKPEVAALLRRHGASLDHKNQTGESARSLAAALANPAMDRALRLRR